VVLFGYSGFFLTDNIFHKGFHNIEVAWIVGADAAGIIVQEDYVGFHVTFTVCNSENNIISVDI
jgi:hypothetical protein